MSEVSLALGVQIKAVIVNQGSGPRLIRVLVPGMQGPPGVKPDWNADPSADNGIINRPNIRQLIEGCIIPLSGVISSNVDGAENIPGQPNIYYQFESGFPGTADNGINLPYGGIVVLAGQTNPYEKQFYYYLGGGYAVSLRYIFGSLTGGREWRYRGIVTQGSDEFAGSVWKSSWSGGGDSDPQLVQTDESYGSNSGGAPSINQNEVLAREASGNGPAAGIPIGTGLDIVGGELVVTAIPGNVPDGGTTGQALKKLSNDDQDIGWVDDETGGGGGGSSVSISGTVTQAMANQTTYVCTATSSDYTVTMTTAGLSAGDVVTFIFPSGNTKMVTLSCAGGLAGSGNRAMRNGESAVLRWSGSTFERVGGVNRPFLAVFSKSDAGQTLTNSGATLKIAYQLADVNPGYGVCDVANSRFVIPRAGNYVLLQTTAFYQASSSGLIQRLISGIRKNGTSTYFAVYEDQVGGAGGATSLIRVPGSQTAALVAGDVLENEAALVSTAVTSVQIFGSYPLEYSTMQITELPLW